MDTLETIRLEVEVKVSNVEMLRDIRSAVKVGPDRGGIELNAWEEDFVANVAGLIDRAEILTDKQQAKLEEIWDRI